MEDLEHSREDSEVNDIAYVRVTGSIKKVDHNKRTGGFVLSIDLPESEVAEAVKLMTPLYNQLVYVTIIPASRAE